MIKKCKEFCSNFTADDVLTSGVISGIFATCAIGFLAITIMMYNGQINFSGSAINLQISDYSVNEVSPVVANVAKTPAAILPAVAKNITTDKPKVELFIMSYCPYGLQMQKAYLPVMTLLGKKADIDIKFVSYAMHEKKEIDENTRQYCIEKEQADKYINYSQCFASSGDVTACLTTAIVDVAKLTNCIAETDKNFKITDLYNNKASWLNGRFPIYPVHKDLNDKYQVQGSPTLVINGAQVEVDRTPEAIKTAVCAAFSVKPAECDTTLSSVGFEPGFGAGAGATQQAACQ